MEFQFTDEQEALRKEVDEVLERHLQLGHFKIMTDGWMRQPRNEGTEALSKEMVERGWCGMTWPKEYGGHGRTYLDRLVVTDRAPSLVEPDSPVDPDHRSAGFAQQRQ